MVEVSYMDKWKIHNNGYNWYRNTQTKRNNVIVIIVTEHERYIKYIPDKGLC